MPDSFIIYALLAGLGVSLTAGVLGCFVIWRRMAYFGDSLAHSALLGVALGLISGLGVQTGIVMICALFALLLLWLQEKSILATDTLLGILSHGALALGLVAVSLFQLRVDVYSYLFGDILTVRVVELVWIYAAGVAVLGLLLRFWSSLILTVVNEELARAESVSVPLVHGVLILSLTLMVAVSVQVVGILLMASLLMIPPAAVRPFAKTPERMAVLSCLFGMVAVFLGISISFLLDTPSGPTVVAVAAGLFALSFPVKGLVLR